MKDFIAIFDSGIGGLSVYRDLKEMLDKENIVYFADTANCPYGIKTTKEVHDITMNNIKMLKDMGAKAVVIACNTATCSVTEEIENGDGSVIGVVKPTAILAYEVSKTKQIGLFATNLTVKLGLYNKYLKDAKVCSVGCSDFVPLVENGMIDSVEMDLAIRNHIEELNNVDTLILGCTHFPFLSKQISDYLPDVKLIESGIATTNVLIEYLSKNNLLSNHKNRNCIFMTSGNIFEEKSKVNKMGFTFDGYKKNN